MQDNETLYKEFLQRDDLIVDMDGKRYYRLAWSSLIRLSFLKKDILAVCPHPELPNGKEYLYEDENGHHFIFRELHHYSFQNAIPEWFLRSGEWDMEWQETEEIGEYLTALPK